jgi:hypothetical protein
MMMMMVLVVVLFVYLLMILVMVVMVVMQVLELRERKELQIGAQERAMSKKAAGNDDVQTRSGPIDLLWYSAACAKPFTLTITNAQEVMRNSTEANKLFGIGVRCGSFTPQPPHPDPPNPTPHHPSLSSIHWNLLIQYIPRTVVA